MPKMTQQDWLLEAAMRLIRYDAGFSKTPFRTVPMMTVHEKEMRTIHLISAASQMNDPVGFRKANAWLEWTQVKDFLLGAMERMIPQR